MYNENTLKNAIRFLYLRNLSKVENSTYNFVFSYLKNDDKDKDLDFFIDRNISKFNLKNSDEDDVNKLNEIRYLYIKSNFIFNKNNNNYCMLTSNFSSDVKLSNCFMFADIIDEQIKDNISNDWKSKFDLIAKLMKESFEIYDKTIIDISVDKNMAIVEGRWADVGINEILFRRLNLIGNEIFKPFEVKN